jgi:hypothetical protein
VSGTVMSEVAGRGSTTGGARSSDTTGRGSMMDDASLSGRRGRGNMMAGGRPRGGIGSATLSGGTVGGGIMRGVGGKSRGGGLLLHERGCTFWVGGGACVCVVVVGGGGGALPPYTTKPKRGSPPVPPQYRQSHVILQAAWHSTDTGDGYPHQIRYAQHQSFSTTNVVATPQGCANACKIVSTSWWGCGAGYRWRVAWVRPLLLHPPHIWQLCRLQAVDEAVARFFTCDEICTP